MNPEVIIRSAQDGTVLRFSDPVASRDEEGLACFTVSLSGPLIQASARIDSFESGNLPAYFENIAACWKGWKGEKRWENVENELELVATSDSLGHVFLSFTLRSGHSDFAWTVSGRLLLEAGQLDAIAQEMSAFYATRAV